MNKPERKALDYRKYYQKLRSQAIIALGAKCARCGYNENMRALQVDHVNGGGTKEIRYGRGIGGILRDCRDGIDIERYQLLCANCNMIKKFENNEESRRVYNDEQATVYSDGVGDSAL